MKKLVSVLLALLLCALALSALAEGYTPAAPKADAAEEEYLGDWICKYAGKDDHPLDVESHFADFGMEAPMTLHFSDGMAQMTGIAELDGSVIPFAFADGSMVFIPEGEDPVFTMTLLEDGVLTFQFNMIPDAAILYLFKAEAE